MDCEPTHLVAGSTAELGAGSLDSEEALHEQSRVSKEATKHQRMTHFSMMIIPRETAIVTS